MKVINYEVEIRELIEQLRTDSIAENAENFSSKRLATRISYYFFNLSTNFFLNLATFGATTAAQYGWFGLLAKYS
ncbi:hypothetical protein BH20ACI1_BH20ACI1_31080 [soil metagenome]